MLSIATLPTGNQGFTRALLSLVMTVVAISRCDEAVPDYVLLMCIRCIGTFMQDTTGNLGLRCWPAATGLGALVQPSKNCNWGRCGDNLIQGFDLGDC